MSRRSLPLLLPVFLAFALHSPVLHAQARVAVYGTVGGEKSGIPNAGWGTAGIVGLYAGTNNFGPLAVAVDVRGDFASDHRSFLAGPRLALHFPAFPLKPYSEILVGRTSYDKTSSGFQRDANWNASYVGGIDTTIFPHIDWRIFDFTYKLNDSGSSNHQKALTTGLVLRF
jgi:hypothetical protein